MDLCVIRQMSGQNSNAELRFGKKILMPLNVFACKKESYMVSYEKYQILNTPLSI